MKPNWVVGATTLTRRQGAGSPAPYVLRGLAGRDKPVPYGALA